MTKYSVLLGQRFGNLFSFALQEIEKLVRNTGTLDSDHDLSKVSGRWAYLRGLAWLSGFNPQTIHSCYKSLKYIKICLASRETLPEYLNPIQNFSLTTPSKWHDLHLNRTLLLSCLSDLNQSINQISFNMDT